MLIPNPLKVAIESWLSTLKLGPSYQIVKLAGDGSTREFFRLKVSTNAFVILFDPTWTLSQDYPAHQRFLKNCKIPVPEFHFSDPKSGVLVMEDLGDEFLQVRLDAEPTKKLGWLTHAIELLAKLHGETFPVPANLPITTRRFDQKKYGDELRFTLEHLSHKLLGFPEATDQQLKLVDQFSAELETLTPEVFSHRDYHCRNILLKGDALRLIDFQDARLGPPHYDVCSLIYDAYTPISDSDRNTLLGKYKSALSHFVVSDGVNWDSFSSDVKFVAYQRTLKAAGSFASFYTRNGKTTHLKYLLPALKSAHELEASLPASIQQITSVFPLEKWIGAVQTLKLQ